MTTQGERVSQTHDTMDLFAAFADQFVGEDPEPTDAFAAATIRATLWCLTDIDIPMAADVLDEIHAERRRCLSE